MALPGALGWLLNRRRYLTTLPSMERKLRIMIDWSLDFIFNNDTSGFLEHDYQSRAQQMLSQVPATDLERESPEESHDMIIPNRKAS